MNLAGKEVSQREVVLLAVTLIVAVGFGISWLGRKVGVGGEESPLEFYATLTTSSERLAITQQRISSLCKGMHLGKFQIPSTEESAKVLSYIDGVARSSGLSFPSLTATAPKKGRKFQTINYRFTTTSDLNALVKFVDEIQKGEYLICLEGWDMKPAEDQKKIVANLTLRSYYGPAEGGKK